MILDTSFIVTAGRFEIDINSELSRLLSSYHYYIVPETEVELQEITAKSDAQSRAAKLAMALLKPPVTPSNRKVFKRADEAILELATSETIVATQDKDLQGRLKKKGVRCITIRQKNYLVFWE